MSAVVGCETCGEFKQVPMERIGTRCKCGGSRSLVLTVEQNKERWRRGISLEEWFAAPRVPANREACESRRLRPCPHLRCEHHLGVPGQHGCAADEGDDGPQTLARIAELLGTTPSAISRDVANVRRKYRDAGVELPNVPEDDEEAA